MTNEQKEILIAGTDMLINAISNSINSSEPGKKQEGRDYLKKVMEAAEVLIEIKTKD